MHRIMYRKSDGIYDTVDFKSLTNLELFVEQALVYLERLEEADDCALSGTQHPSDTEEPQPKRSVTSCKHEAVLTESCPQDTDLHPTLLHNQSLLESALSHFSYEAPEAPSEEATASEDLQ